MSPEKTVDNGKDARSWIGTAALLIFATCLSMIPSIAYVPLVPAIKKALGMNFSQFGFFTGLAGIIAIICAVPAGATIKKLGSRKVFLVSNLMVITGLLLLSLSSNFIEALSGRAIWQIGLRFLIQSLTVALVIAVPDKHRSTVMGTNIAISMSGTIVAQNIGAWLSQEFGWQIAIRFFAALVALAGVMFFLFYKKRSSGQTSAPAPEKTVQAAVIEEKGSVYARPALWMLCLLVLFSCEEGLVDGFAALQMGEIWNINAVGFSRIISIGLIIAVVANLTGGFLGDKFNRWNLLIITGILNAMVGVCLLIGQYNNIAFYIVGLLLAKAVQMTTTMFVNSMAPSFLGVKNVAPVIAIIQLGAGMGQYVGPQVLGILRDATKGYTAGWIFIAVSGLAATMFSIGFKIYFSKKNEKQTA